MRPLDRQLSSPSRNALPLALVPFAVGFVVETAACGAAVPPALPVAQPSMALPASPPSGLPTETTIASATPPQPAPPKPPLPPPSLADENGCFGWSGTEHVAACVVSNSSIAHGCIEALVFIGPSDTSTYRMVDVPPQCLGPQTRNLSQHDEAAFRARLQTRSYEPISASPVSVAPSERSSAAGVTVEYKREKVGHVSLVDGTWDVFSDAILVGCGKGKTAVWRTRIENPGESRADAFRLEPGWVLLTMRTSYGIEGDIGSRFTATVIDTSRCIFYGHGAE